MATSVNPETLDQLSQLFSDTLHTSASRKQAEQNLTSLERQPEQHFPILLLSLISSARHPNHVRLAAAIKLKNICRRAWSEEEALEVEDPSQVSAFQLVCEPDRQHLKQNLLPLLVQLSQPAVLADNPAGLRLQLSESIALIAKKDFPDAWPNLLDEIVVGMQTSAPDSVALQAILQTAHSIFRRWRSAFRSDLLYTDINYVLSRFAQPFLTLLKQTDEVLSQPTPPPTTSSTLLRLLQLFHDLSAQDLPPLFEDNLPAIFALLLKYLNPRATPDGIYTKNSALAKMMDGTDDDTTPQDGQKIRAEICSIGELYAQRYLDAAESIVPSFVTSVWEMLGGCGKEEKEDILVSRAISFLSAVVKMPSQRNTFESDATLEAFVSAIILPNISLREQDEEMFEDEPLEWIRREFAMESGDADTRRRAASSFCRSLLEQFSDQITSIISRYINQYLQKYQEKPADNWRYKDTAVYLLTSIASTSSTAAHGVSSTNALVDVIKFFSDNVFVDLQADPSSVHPILQVDAIKYLHTFRNQLTKEQLLSVLPLLVRHLESASYVTSSYAAITIERILFLKAPQSTTTPLFSPADVTPFAESILMALFRNIKSGGSPEKIAENDYLMRCVMRLIVTARESLLPGRAPVLANLCDILGEILKNPSNPKFSQYCFESISALIRFVVAADPATVSEFEQQLSTPLMTILQLGVTEFVPFVFQILSQILELHRVQQIPASFTTILPSLLMPALWQTRSNIPALVRLLQAYLAKNSSEVATPSNLQSFLGIYQLLIASRINDDFGFDLLLSVFAHVDSASLDPYKAPALTLMLTRLQGSKTEKFSRGFVSFVASLCGIEKIGFSDYVIGAFDAVQPGLFSQLLQGVILPDLPKVLPRQRRVVAAGLSRLLLTSTQMLQQSALLSVYPAALTALLKMVNDQSLTATLSSTDAAIDANEIFLQDWEDQSLGSSSTFAVLRSSSTPYTALNLTGFLGGQDVRRYLGQGLKELHAREGPKIDPILGQLDPSTLAPFQQYMV